MKEENLIINLEREIKSSIAKLIFLFLIILLTPFFIPFYLLLKLSASLTQWMIKVTASKWNWNDL